MGPQGKGTVVSWSAVYEHKTEVVTVDLHRPMMRWASARATMHQAEEEEDRSDHYLTAEEKVELLLTWIRHRENKG
jgi:hypothetical protein